MDAEGNISATDHGNKIAVKVASQGVLANLTCVKRALLQVQGKHKTWLSGAKLWSEGIGSYTMMNSRCHKDSAMRYRCVKRIASPANTIPIN